MQHLLHVSERVFNSAGCLAPDEPDFVFLSHFSSPTLHCLWKNEIKEVGLLSQLGHGVQFVWVFFVFFYLKCWVFDTITGRRQLFSRGGYSNIYVHVYICSMNTMLKHSFLCESTWAARCCFWPVAIKAEHLLYLTVVAVVVVRPWQLLISSTTI